MSDRPIFIVAVDAFEGEYRSILVLDGAGNPAPVVYCVATMNETTGVLQFVDYGYTTAQEARAAWPHAMDR